MNRVHNLALLGALASFGLASESTAQEVLDSAAQEDEIIVTGTRSAGRAALEASTPISVVTNAQMNDLGFGDVARSLEYLEPSLNYPRAATTATTANSRPATLRGLSPDQVLVLVNGKRRHTTAILNINNTVGRGSAGVDFDMVPSAAIERIEILRDGAAAQYGSDAIAGVINIILKDGAEGGMMAAQGGVSDEGDGVNFSLSGHGGFALTDAGHIAISGEMRRQETTNRALIDQRFGRVTYEFGDPEISLASFAVDASAPFFGGDLYAFGTFTWKNSTNAAGFRTPTFLPAVYPNGFLPKINPTIWDGGATAGWRTDLAHGWSVDFSHTFGYDEAEFEVFDTANVSLGAASSKRFDAGAITYRQNVTDLTLSRPLDNFLAGGNIAVGLQNRVESYRGVSGEPAASFGAGADGFAGFNPDFGVERDAQAAFVDLEVRPIEKLFLGAAVRYDDYSDFGEASTWRVTGRYDFTDFLAVRASAGTGFRAPSPQQQSFRVASGALSGTGVLTTVGTLPVSDPVARLLGATDLKPEESRNVAAGLVVNAGIFSLTADWFRIEIEDRIVLSEQLAGASVTNILTGAGITNFQQVRFFTNAADTTTEGFEVAARYQADLGAAGSLRLSAGYGQFETTLDTVRANAVLPALPFLQTRARLHLVSAQPDHKVTFEGEWEKGPLALQANITNFGTYTAAPLGNTFVQEFGEKTVVDLSGRLAAPYGVTLALGVQNVGDVRPDALVHNGLASIIAATGGSFPTGEESPIGVNGRTFFARVEKRF